MSLLRLIARLDIKGPNVVKGICFEGLRVVGNPVDLAKKYAESGADELFYIDTVATLYGRNQLEGLLDRTVAGTFLPITVGGGISSVEEAKRLLDAGADKIALNTAAIREPDLVARLSTRLGVQGVVVSIEAKKTPQGWEAYTDNGREKTGKDAIAWAHEAVELGAGEILITSIDRDGTMKGPDTALLEALGWIPVPLVYGGGIATVEHAREALNAGADALAIGAALHYNKTNFQELREWIKNKNSPTGPELSEKLKNTVT